MYNINVIHFIFATLKHFSVNRYMPLKTFHYPCVAGQLQKLRYEGMEAA